MCSDVKLTRGNNLHCQTDCIWNHPCLWGHFQGDPSEGGWHHPMKCGPRLNKKEDARWAKTFISLLPDCRQCGLPPHASVQMPSLLCSSISPHTVSQTKRGGEERKRRKKWWGGQKKRKNYKLPKKNYKLNFIKINNVCTLKDDYQANRKDILINH